jgi:hypothetical protein
MTPKEYQQYWKKQPYLEFYQLDPEKIDAGKITSETLKFLVTYGIPSGAAPMLSFDNDLFYTTQRPDEYFGFEDLSLSNYMVIGFNGSGDTLCIDRAKNEEIVYLNHDNDFERIFINSNLQCLMFCVTAYARFIDRVNTTDSSNFINGRITPQQREELKNELLSIDGRILESGSLWKYELERAG